MKRTLFSIPVVFTLLTACTSLSTATPILTPQVLTTTPVSYTLAPTPVPLTLTPTSLPLAPTVTPPSSTLTPLPPTPTQTPIPLEFELLGVPASYSPKQTHWSLFDLQLWHDRIYLAHGNWDTNTGPVRAMYLDLETTTFVHDEGFAFDDEAIEKFHVYNDVLYAPGVDATESWDFGNVYFKQWGVKWTKLRTIPRSIHVFDIAVLGKTLVASGQTDLPVDAGCFWVSGDNGQTWKQCYQLRPGILDSVSLYTSLFVLRDRLYVATPRDGCFVFENETWGKVSCLPASHARVSQHVIYRNVAVMLPYWRDSELGRQLYFFNGTEQWSVNFRWPVRDAVSSPEGLYVLVGISSGDGVIFYASNFDCRCDKDFKPIAEFDMSKDKPQNPRGNAPLSLEYAKSRFYVGFADGRLFRSKPYQR